MPAFGPDQTRYWSTRELDALIGKRVTADIDNIHRSGVVEYASVGRGDIAFIDWVDGGSTMWRRETTPVTITVEEG